MTRIRTAGSHEGKADRAGGRQELVVCQASRALVLGLGREYEPESWCAYERRRKAEGRRYFLELMAKRDEENGRTNREIKQARATIASERATRGRRTPHRHALLGGLGQTRTETELQRKLNQKNRAAL